VNWWCSATGQAWTWAWRPYIGVWILLVILGGTYIRVRSRALAAGVTWPGGRVVAFVGGLLLLWAALDWPIGPLGAGYLVTVHTFQYMLLGLLAPPLLLVACPPDAWLRFADAPRSGSFLRTAAHPLLALAVFNVVLLGSHVPGVVDALMPSQLGSFVFDMTWLAAGLALWWPVVAPPGLSRMSEPVKMGYLFGATINPTDPAAFLTFADYPIYGLYELAPRVMGIGAQVDLQAAGLLMKVGGDPIFLIAIAVVFFRWSAAERRADESERLARSSLSRHVSV
jgi:putative membrane protein